MSAKIRKQFEFSKFKQRHIALKLLYFGWEYDGLAEQESSDNTVEYHLINALTKTCLIESRKKCKFSRCGRTDKGVSSYGQVVDLNVRSNLFDESDPQNVGLFTPDDYTGPTSKDSELSEVVTEINYLDILNRVLPEHIKAIAWAPVGSNFSSRFNCLSRSYSYVFPRGDLCIESIERALTYLIGRHDFRNLCSFDLKNNVINHVRTILDAKIRPLSASCDQLIETSSLDSQYKFYEIIIVGQAFLYHQIRCIMTMLFLVGRNQEQPELVRDLLDLDKCPSRPSYCRASPMPLSLFDCQYDPGDLPQGWNYSQQTLFNVFRGLKKLWLDYKTKTVMIERVLFNVESSILGISSPGDGENSLNLSSWKDFGLVHDNMSDSKYIPVLKRPRDEILESRIQQMNARKKLRANTEASSDDYEGGNE